MRLSNQEHHLAPLAPSKGAVLGRAMLGSAVVACALAGGTLLSPRVLAQPSPASAAGARALLPASALSELRTRVLAAGMTQAQADGFLANVRNLDVAQFRALADAAQVSRLQQLIPNVQSSAPPSGDPSRGSGLGSGSALQGSVQGALRPGAGGMVTSNTAKASDGSCQACPGTLKSTFTTGGTSGQSLNPDGPQPRTIQTAIGGTIVIHPDGSASITGKDGKTEYINSEGRIVDKNGKATEPLPDQDARSNRVTAEQLAAAVARQNRNRTTNPEANGSAGGPVSGDRSNPVGSRATFTDPTARSNINITQVREAIRVIVEKVAGPGVR